MNKMSENTFLVLFKKLTLSFMTIRMNKMPENTESTSVPKNTESTGVPKNTASTNVLENTKSAYDYLFDGDRAFYSSYGLQNATDVKKFMDSPGGDSMKTAVAGELARLDEERKRGLSDTEGQLKRQRILVALVIAKEKNSARDPQIPNEYDKNVKILHKMQANYLLPLTKIRLNLLMQKLESSNVFVKDIALDCPS